MQFAQSGALNAANEKKTNLSIKIVDHLVKLVYYLLRRFQWTEPLHTVA